MKILPLHDKMLVERLEAEAVSPGGIIIPDQAQEKPLQGRVVAVGPGKYDEKGVRQPMTVKEGDLILFGKYAGTDVEVDGKKLLLLRDDDVFGIVKQG